MSSGHKGDEPASLGSVIRVIQLNPGLNGHLRDYRNIDRSFRVPYGAGSSIDGGTVYIDANTPERFAKSNVEPDEFWSDHEAFEWWLMTRRGFDYARAHKMAHGFERYRMKLSGISDEQIEQYETESMAGIDADEHAKLPPEAFPPDLYLGPYESDEDELDAKLLPILRQAQFIKRAA